MTYVWVTERKRDLIHYIWYKQVFDDLPLIEKECEVEPK